MYGYIFTIPTTFPFFTSGVPLCGARVRHHVRLSVQREQRAAFDPRRRIQGERRQRRPDQGVLPAAAERAVSGQRQSRNRIQSAFHRGRDPRHRPQSRRQTRVSL